MSCSRCQSGGYWSTWWESARSVTLTATAAKAAHRVTTATRTMATRTMATPTASTATEVTAIPTEVTVTPTEVTATPTEVTATPTEVTATPTEVTVDTAATGTPMAREAGAEAEA